jgi:hypothetical protein
MPVRNEEWILRASISAALQWVDELLVLCHACEDRSVAIARSFPRVSVCPVHDPAWAEMAHRQQLLAYGRALGGTHFALVDADEILTANALGDVRGEIGDLEPGECLDVPMIPVWGGLGTRRADDCVWSRAWLTLAFRDAPGLSWRPRGDGYEHHHRAPYGALRPSAHPVAPTLERGFGGVMHLQFADRARLRAKHALYKMQEVVRWPGRECASAVDARYNQALDERGLALAPVPPEWWEGYDVEGITLGGVPWQRAMCRELMRRHGPEAFRGLELWGEAW